jgi:ABC-2 type transport system ATP-binding protein
MTVLEADRARVVVDDVVAIDSLTVTATGDRVLCTGDVSALIGAITGVPLGRPDEDGTRRGEARVAAGELRIGGASVAHGEHRAIAGCAPLDPPIAPSWTCLEYVSWSGRLAGLGSGRARTAAIHALNRVGLGPAAGHKADSLALADRRVLVLAQAIVADPRVLIAEAPLAHLDAAGAARVLSALAGATDGRGALVSVTRLDAGTPEGDLARAATCVLVFSGGELALEGPPSEIFAGARIYGLTVPRNADALRTELAARGIQLRGGPLRWTASVPAGLGTPDILASAVAARAPVVEMLPIV